MTQLLRRRTLARACPYICKFPEESSPYLSIYIYIHKMRTGSNSVRGALVRRFHFASTLARRRSLNLRLPFAFSRSSGIFAVRGNTFGQREEGPPLPLSPRPHEVLRRSEYISDYTSLRPPPGEDIFPTPRRGFVLAWKIAPAPVFAERVA